MAFILDQGTPHDLNEDWQGHCCAWNPTIPAHIPSSTIGTLESVALPLSVFRADLGDIRLPSSRLSSGSLSWTFDQRGTEAGQRWSTVKFKTTDLHRAWNETLVFQKTPGIFHDFSLYPAFVATQVVSKTQPKNPQCLFLETPGVFQQTQAMGFHKYWYPKMDKWMVWKIPTTMICGYPHFDHMNISTPISGWFISWKNPI